MPAACWKRMHSCNKASPAESNRFESGFSLAKTPRSPRFFWSILSLLCDPCVLARSIPLCARSLQDAGRGMVREGSKSATASSRRYGLKLRLAARWVESGGIIAYPTEAVFGLGCDPLNPDAVHRLLDLKRRPAHKGLILIAADVSQLLPFVELLPDALMRPVLASWPGPVTWLFPTRPDTPDWLIGSHDTLAVRVTAHALAASLCRRCGPLVSTSANQAGSHPARTPLEVRLRLPEPPDLILHAPLGDADRPSRILDARTGRAIRV